MIERVTGSNKSAKLWGIRKLLSKIQFLSVKILSSIGVYFGHGHTDNVSKIVPSVTDNNIAEAMAVLEAIRIGRKQKAKNVRIYNDSQNVIDIINSSRVKNIYRLKNKNQPYPIARAGIKLIFLLRQTLAQCK